MFALLKYLNRTYINSFKYVAPLFFYFTFIWMTYYMKPNPVLESYAFTSLVVFVFVAWIGYGFVDSEEIIHQQLTILHSRSGRKYYTSKIIFMLLFALFIAIISTVFPIIFNCFGFPMKKFDVIISIISHTVLGLMGSSIAFLLNSRMVRERKSAILLLVGIITVSMVKVNFENAHIPIKWILYLVPPSTEIAKQIPFLYDRGLLNSIILFSYPIIYLIFLSGCYVKFMNKKMF